MATTRQYDIVVVKTLALVPFSVFDISTSPEIRIVMYNYFLYKMGKEWVINHYTIWLIIELPVNAEFINSIPLEFIHQFQKCMIFASPSHMACFCCAAVSSATPREAAQLHLLEEPAQDCCSYLPVISVFKHSISAKIRTSPWFWKRVCLNLLSNKWVLI